MPYVLMQAHVRALDRLTAEQTLRDSMVTAWGGANLRPEDARGFMRDLERRIHGPKKRKPATNKELRSMFGGG